MVLSIFIDSSLIALFKASILSKGFEIKRKAGFWTQGFYPCNRLGGRFKKLLASNIPEKGEN
jgi:hypothetical protein